ncbi:DHA2 family efflux MFS transporter permease subunit [Kibdelosporangium aridum]|uniref:DHA2 family efflux MFS transporter permease subunit n=1 Tax=Kibdelosporangium aridum TaxID=2030 RepID=UPI0035EBEDBE
MKLVPESRPADPGKIDGPLVKVILVVLLGSVMTTIDMTIINVALQPLTLQFQTSLDTIQWIATGYLLALGMVVPVTGWASDRFGTKRLFMVAIASFVVGSVLAGAAWNVETLIAFRVLQGFGGGMLAPAALTILTNAAGPHRIGRAMAALGVPMLLGPIADPVLGGWLVDEVNWRWIFYINVPVGAVAILMAWRLLPRDEPRPAEKVDLPGVLMLSPSLAALIYGISNIPHHGGVTAVAVWLPALLGVLLLVGFIVHALKTENPLIDLTLFRNRTFTAATATMTLYMIAFLGAMMVVPTYFMLVRGHGALAAGLLVAPQGIGALLTMPIAGRLADRIGAGKVVLPGLVLIMGSFAMLTKVGADSPYWLLMLALFVAGLGMGMSMMPINSAALQTLTKRMVARASAALTVVQQTAGAIGAAVVSIILAGLLAGQFGVSTSDGQLAATAALADPATRDAAAAASASAFASTFVWTLVLVVLCLIPAAFLPKRRIQSSTEDEAADENVPPPVVIH